MPTTPTDPMSFTATAPASRTRKESRHWVIERVTALLLIPLMPWLALSLAALPAASYADCIAWIGQPLHAISLLAFLFISAQHAALGLESVIIDYVQHPLIQRLSLWAVRLALLGVLATASVAVYLLLSQN